MHDTEIKPTKAIVVAVDTQSYDTLYSLEELKNLCESLHIEVLATVIQNREKVDNALYLGKGKLQEIHELQQSLQADYVIVDDELSASQMRNIETITSLPVLDRTTIILDIFAQNAKSKEGKIQVELAQYKYRLPRLTGYGASLSRLGAGIGTRGPGESKLETDKRHIYRRMDKLKESLALVQKQRLQKKQQRIKNEIPTVAIVGYTNVGKSTLLNLLTQGDVLAQDKLFATLDPTAKKFVLPNNTQIVFIDTVGFVSRLPHHLIQSFSSTLEVAKEADLIINLMDASSPYFTQQLAITKEVLQDIKAHEVPLLPVLNKCDSIDECILAQHLQEIPDGICISCKTEKGIQELITKIQDILCVQQETYTLVIPYQEGGLLSYLQEKGNILKTEFQPTGTWLTISLDKRLAYKIEQYIIPPS